MKFGMCMEKFDVEFDSDRCDPYTNADLLLTLRLGFEQINPAGGAQEGVYHDYGDNAAPTRKIVRWTAGGWEQWKKNFVTSAAKFWNGKFWLSNNFDLYSFETKGKRYRPNVFCSISITGNDAKLGNQHHTIQVVKLHPSESWFGSNSNLYDSLDTNSVQKGTDSAGTPIMQRAHVHEVGHLLGLDHVDVGKPNCPPSNTNAASCYGVADIDKNSVMGEGMQIRVEQAAPWRRAMIAVSSKGRMLTLTDWEAKLQRIYPRLPEEIATNQMIIKRPVRT